MLMFENQDSSKRFPFLDNEKFLLREFFRFYPFTHLKLFLI